MTLAEAKKNIELPEDYAYHDDQLHQEIQFAREQVEHDTGIIAGQSTFVIKRAAWPADGWIEFSIRPVTLVVVTYVDTNGATQTWSSANWTLSTTTLAPTIFLGYNQSWPTHRGWNQDITLTLTAGYALASSVPEMFKRAVLMEVARRMADREGMERGEQDTAAYVRSYEMLIRRLQRSSYP